MTAPVAALEKRREALAISLLAVNAVVAGASGSLAKSLLDAGWSVGAINLIRMALAAGLLVPGAAWVIMRRDVRIRGHLKGIVTLGLVGVTGMIICYYNALATLPVGVALLLMSLSPVLILLWAWARYGEPPGTATCVGAIMAMGGLTLVVTATEMGTPSVVGIAWGLGGALCLACYYIWSDHVTTSVPAIPLACSGLVVATVAIGALSLVGLLPFVVGDPSVRLADRSVPAVVPLLVIASLATAFVFVAAFVAVEVLGARMTSFFALTEPIMAFLLAWLLLAEAPTLTQLVGGALILCGVALVRKDGSPRMRRLTKADESPDPFLANPT